MATFKVDGKDIPLGADFSTDTTGQIGVFDLIASLIEKFYESEVGVFIKDLNMENFLAKLRLGDVKAIALCSITVLCLGLSYLLLKGSDNSSSEPEKNVEEKKEEIEMRDFTVEQLRNFDGKGDTPIYIALKGDVFDVTSARVFYGEGSGYNCFAGREATRAMAKLSFEEVDLCSLEVDDLSPFERNNVDEWYSKFKDYKCYPIVGRISTPAPFRDYTHAELLAFKECLIVPEGRINAPILMGINGKVIDVSYGGKEMYGKGGTYFLFAGIDASRALAKMSFKEEDVNNRDLSDLTPEQQKTLVEWETKFIVARKYPVVGKIVV